MLMPTINFYKAKVLLNLNTNQITNIFNLFYNVMIDMASKILDIYDVHYYDS